MKEQGIENFLKNLKAPPPDAAARLRAKRTALAEFERQRAANQDIKLPEEVAASGRLQALLRKLRLSREDGPHGSSSMKWYQNRGLQAAAAGLGVLAIGMHLVLPSLDRYTEELTRAERPAAPTPMAESPMAEPPITGQTVVEPAPMESDMSAAQDAPAAGPVAEVARGQAARVAAEQRQAEQYAKAEAQANAQAAEQLARNERASIEAASANAQTQVQPAAAASAPAPALSPPPPPAETEEIVISGARGSLRKALEVRRSASTAVDAIQADDIGQLPEGSVPESVQRLPTVSLSGEYASGPFKLDGRDRFQTFESNPLHRVADAPVSTFSADVDTASYSFVRDRLNDGLLPQKDAVRAEEMVNYFDYAWPAAGSRSAPFKPTVVVSDSPWGRGRKLVHIGIKGYDVDRDEAPDANLVLLLDVSGSMNEPDKLPLAVRAMEMLLDSLKPTDTVGIVVYAGAAGTVLEPTPARDKAKIVAALRSLRPGGSTAGAAGIERAYQLAEAHFRKGGINRILLATDGDFNVGIAGTEELKGFVERKREKGVYLSVLGFGEGNYRDELAQALAQNGNGVAAYIDTEAEARKVLVREATSSLFTIARDVKLQVEFNPVTVSEYRLVGYETRALKREDFNNDAVDAGDVGAGHTVTAIYEITPVGAETQSIDEPRYPENRKPAPEARGTRDEYGFLKIRYKLPGEQESRLISEAIPLRTNGVPAAVKRDVAFSTAVAGFAQLLRGGVYTGSLTFRDVIELAQSSKGEDRFGYRAEFIDLVRKAERAGRE